MGQPDEQHTEHTAAKRKCTPEEQFAGGMLQKSQNAFEIWTLLNLLRLRFCINYLKLLVQGQHGPKRNHQFTS